MRLLLVLLFGFNMLHAASQGYLHKNKNHGKNILFETGFGAGIMNCTTDLGGGKSNVPVFSVNWINSQPVVNIYFEALYNSRLGLRLDINFGSVTASDSILKNKRAYVNGRYERNLSFRSSINEIQVLGEIYPFGLAGNDRLFKPYLLSGISYYSFNPKTKLQDQWYYLRPLRTEGQGFDEYPDKEIYKLCQLNIQLGGGMRKEWNKLINFRLEVI